MYYSMQILLKQLLDTCYFLCRIMSEVTTWKNYDDNVIVQTGVSPEPESLAESTVESIQQSFNPDILILVIRTPSSQCVGTHLTYFLSVCTHLTSSPRVTSAVSHPALHHSPLEQGYPLPHHLPQSPHIFTASNPYLGAFRQKESPLYQGSVTHMGNYFV